MHKAVACDYPIGLAESGDPTRWTVERTGDQYKEGSRAHSLRPANQPPPSLFPATGLRPGLSASQLSVKPPNPKIPLWLGVRLPG